MTYSGSSHIGIMREERTTYSHREAPLGSYKGLPFVTSGGAYSGGRHEWRSHRKTEIYNDQLTSKKWIELADYPFANN